MKLTRNFVVFDAVTGEETKTFKDEAFASPQDVVIKVSDAERRVSVALASQQIPEKSDLDLVNGVKEKSFTVQEVITFKLKNIFMWGSVVRWFITLAPGYFFNDILSAIAGVVKVEKNSDGKYPVWFPLVVILALALLVVFVISKMFGKGRKGLFSFAAFCLAASAIYFGLDFGLLDGVQGMVLLATLTTGAAAVTTVNTTYVPKYFFYVAATQLTGVRITVQGDGIICDLDAAGLTALRAQRQIGAITNGTMIELSNGFIQGKNVIWEFTNSAAQTPAVYVGSQETQSDAQKMYLTSLRQAILANSGTDFADFAVLGLPALAAADVINALFRDGTQQSFNRIDLQAMCQYTQAQVNTPDYSIDNFSMKYKKVNVIAAAAQTAYVQRWTKVGGLQMIEQQVNAKY